MKEMKKMSLSEMRSLSRPEMKKIMAGSSGVGCDYGCNTNGDCTDSKCPSCEKVNYGDAKFCTNL